MVLKVREGPIQPRKTEATSVHTAERFQQKDQCAHTQAGRVPVKTGPGRAEEGGGRQRGAWGGSLRQSLQGWLQVIVRRRSGVAGGQSSLCKDLLTQHLRSPQQQG